MTVTVASKSILTKITANVIPYYFDHPWAFWWGRFSRFAFLRRETLKIKCEKTSAFLRRERENRFRVFESWTSCTSILWVDWNPIIPYITHWKKMWTTIIVKFDVGLKSKVCVCIWEEEKRIYFNILGTQLSWNVITLLHISNKNRYAPKPCIVTRFC